MKTTYEFGRALCLAILAVVVAGDLLPAMRQLRFPLWALIPVVVIGIWYVLHNITPSESTWDLFRSNAGLPSGVSRMAVPSSLLRDDSGQDIAEYAVMLAVLLVIVVGTIKLVGSHANNVFSAVGSDLGN